MATKPSRAAAAALILALLVGTAAGHNGNGHHPNKDNDNPGNDDPGAFFAGMPWFGGGGGPAGAGFFGGGGGLGYRRGAVVPPSTVCPQDGGPCHGKRLTCPPRCFRTFSYGGKNGGGGGGGGGCSFDCTTRCAATC